VGDGVQPQDAGAFKTLLEQVVQEHFFEEVGPSRYRWVHDKVQEAAMSLLPKEKQVSLQFEVGMSLLRNLNEKELEAAIFIIVNLLNIPSGSIPLESIKSFELAELTLLAAKNAKGSSAFLSAAKYAAAGISLLPEDKWKSHYKLTLELYSIGAETEGILGEIDVAKAYCDEVLNQKGCSIFDKLRLQYALMDTLANCNRAQEALELCLDVLEQFQCKFPKKAGGQACHAILTLLKISRQKYIPTAEEMNGLPLVKDPEKAEVMKLLNLLTTQCYYTKNMLLFVLVFARMFQWTMQYGISDYSPQACNGYGMIFNGVLGDLQGGTKLGEYALLMLEKLTTKGTISRTFQATYTFLLPWTKPLRSSLTPYLEGYKVGMQVGDTESATWCLHFHACAALVVGKPLNAIIADCRISILQMEELKREVAEDSTRLILQCALNLMGRSQNAFILTGEAMDEEECVEKARATKNDTYLNSVDFFKSYLYAYMGEHKLGAKLALSKGDKYLKETPGFFLCMPEAFCRAISLFAMARHTRKIKYKKHAKRVKKTIKSWIKKGNPNVIHYACLLDAEEAALDGKKKEASVLYRKAVTLATRGGFLQDAGLANERYALFLLNDCSQKEEGIYHMNESIRCYSEWGARSKVEMLEMLQEMYARLSSGWEYLDSSGQFESALKSNHL
jgi:predicted ATPase